jgi:hypothetical protein
MGASAQRLRRQSLLEQVPMTAFHSFPAKSLATSEAPCGPENGNSRQTAQYGAYSHGGGEDFPLNLYGSPPWWKCAPWAAKAPQHCRRDADLPLSVSPAWPIRCTGPSIGRHATRGRRLRERSSKAPKKSRLTMLTWLTPDALVDGRVHVDATIHHFPSWSA